jgi:hypothetical protein
MSSFSELSEFQKTVLQSSSAYQAQYCDILV